MVKMSYSFKREARPKELLVMHSLQTARRCRKIQFIKQQFGVSSDFLNNIVYLIGLGHDLGKATTYFQEKLKDTKFHNPVANHGELSAMITWDLIRQYGSKTRVDSSLVNVLGALSYLVVSKHHGGIGNAQTILETEIDDLIFHKQLEALDITEVLAIINESEVPVDYCWDKERLFRLRRSISKEWDKLFDYLGMPLYILHKLLFSLLVAGDKGSVILNGEEPNFQAGSMSVSMVEGFKEKLPKDSQLDIMREELYQEALHSLEKLGDDLILSLNMPTGTGKTLTSMAVACKIKAMLNKQGPIVYCLPFTSVIDQNYQVFYEAIQQFQSNKEPTTNQLLKHHHLVEMDYKDNLKDWDLDESRFLIESWESELIVTTFVQFFHTLAGNANRMLIKFHRLKDSIIILDEIQAVPMKYWGFIRTVLKSLSKELSCHIILVTATMPLLFAPNETIKLIEKPETYFGKLERTKLILHLDRPLALQEFYSELETIIELNDDEDILIVMNTVLSATEVYKHLAKKKYHREYFYLSTYVTPNQRIKRIRALKKSGQKSRIIVTTQLIEAGVDIDVNLVIRDLGPLDSINQVAGRCNRHSKRKIAEEVHIFWLVDEKGRDYARIYGTKSGNELIEATLETFKTFGSQGIVPESKYWELNKTYFDLVDKKRTENYDGKLIQMAERLEHAEVAKNFQLIENLPKIAVFVQLDNKAKELWQNYIDIIDNQTGWMRNQAFQAIKRNFLEYVINVNEKDAADLTGNENYKLVPYEKLKHFYHRATGFIKKGADLS